MSEDLRYYFFDNEAEPEPPVSAEEGWKQMEQLLDKHMPTKRRRIVAYWPYGVAASLLVAALVAMIYLKSGDNQHANVVAQKQQKVSSQQQNNNLTIQKENSEETGKPENNIAYNRQGNTYHNQYTLKSLGRNPSKNMIDYSATGIKQGIADNSQSVATPGNTSNTTLPATAENATLNEGAGTANGITASTENNNKNKQQLLPADNLPTPYLIKPAMQHKGSWNFSAGMGVNMATAGNNQYLQPYPVAEAKYNVSNRFFVSAGIAPYAPTTASASGVDKSTIVNDLARNVSHYDERTTYSRVNYLDVPLMAGVHITKNFSLQGGVQVSWMLNSKSQKTYETYDLMMNRVETTTTMQANIGPAFSPGAIVEKESEISVNKTDYRYVAGVQYSLKKATIGLQYQQGLQPVLYGTNTSGKKNNLVSLKVNFRIR